MKINKFQERKKKVKAKILGKGNRPRLSVFRSNRGIYGQIIDDTKARTLVASGGIGKKAEDIGTELAKKALTKKVKRVVFDRGGYKYHGKIKTLAEAARKGGLEF